MKITRNSLFRKISIISIAVLVFVSSLLGSSINTANAASTGSVLKLAAGSEAESIILAAMEKGGITFPNKSARDTALQRWRMSSYERYQADNLAGKNDDVWNQLKTIETNPPKVEPIPDRPGFGKVLLNTATYLAAFDIGYQIGNEIKTAVDEQSIVSLMDYNIQNLEGQTAISQLFSIGTVVEERELETSVSLERALPDGTVDRIANTLYDNRYDGYLLIRHWDLVGMTLSIFIERSGVRVGTTDVYKYSETQSIELTSFDLNYPHIFDSVPTSAPVVDVPPLLDPLSAPNEFPESNPDLGAENVELIIPMDNPEAMNSPDPWNEPIPDTGTEEPPPTGGGETPTEEGFDPTNPWKDMLPIAFLLALLDLLRAILAYLSRMFTFILTIPLIPPIPIDNVAFQWFKTAEIVGVEIYIVISSLASIGLSFMVYKAIRRMIP